MSAPVAYRTTIRHARTERVRHAFRYRHRMWLVDLDDVPPAPTGLGGWRPRFLARDHLGDPSSSIRENVERYLRAEGIELDGGRILMLANPRSFGYVFNPLTVFWAYDGDGTLRAIVAEVHNTFGERHCYLVDPAGDPSIDKELYVSPFFSVDGTYDMRIGEPAETVRLAITLRRAGATTPAFTATLAGRREASTRRFSRSALRDPWPSLRVIARIHWQALRLWLRRVPVVPRPLAPRQEHVS